VAKTQSEILSNVVYRRVRIPLLNEWLGGLLGLFFAIDELNADHYLGDEFKALESAPMLLGRWGRSRTVAKVDLIGLVVRKCANVGPGKKVNSTSLSLCKHSQALGNLLW
jgi:hypothetical protein